MPIHQYASHLVAMTCLLAFSISVQAQLPSQTIYKWTDENGVVHYEMRKPVDTTTTVEVIKKPLTETATPEATVPAPQAAATTDQKETEAAAPTASKPKKDPKICELARSNLEQLQNRRYVSAKDEYGNERILDEKEVANQIKRAKEAIKANCN